MSHSECGAKEWQYYPSQGSYNISLFKNLFKNVILRFDCKYSILRKFKSFLTISHTDDPLWTRYWGVMKNDKLNLWLYPSDEDSKGELKICLPKNFNPLLVITSLANLFQTSKSLRSGV